MGLIICDKHGEEFIALTCEHIQQSVQNHALNPYGITHVTHGVEGMISLRHWFCEQCAQDYSVPLDGFSQIITDEELDTMEDDELMFDGATKAAGYPVCSKCFRESFPLLTGKFDKGR